MGREHDANHSRSPVRGFGIVVVIVGFCLHGPPDGRSIVPMHALRSSGIRYFGTSLLKMMNLSLGDSSSAVPL
ncbi:hypothetical protein DSP71_04850 [Microbacterium sp. H6]|nr:hypothetical protein DSP71_04850 [Microbacterium sp. H6]